MKKILLVLAAVACLTATSTAHTKVSLQGTEFKVDTVAHYYIGPGVTQTILKFSSSDRVFPATILDMNKDEAVNVVPEVILGNDSCRIAETVSSMGKRHTTADRQVLGGSNGDFFIVSSFASVLAWGDQVLGFPNMSCMIDRKLASPDIIDIGSREKALIMAEDNWYIDSTDLLYQIMSDDEATVVNAFAANFPRRGSEMVFYNHYYGKYTSTDQSGRELTLRLVEGETWGINKNVRFQVIDSWHQGGCSAIPTDGIVISCGSSYANTFVDGLKAGDIVKMRIDCKLPNFDNVRPDIINVVGGDVRILKNNEVVKDEEVIRFINTPSSKYGRSLVGYSKDRKHMVLCTVDAGILGYSGVSYYEGADLMRFLGCWDALDLDGGGSCTMWSASHGIVNTLRDGSERAVGNGIFFTLKAPADSKLTSIRFADPVMYLPMLASYTPTIYGYNQYGQLVNTDVKGFELQADKALGSVDGSSLLVTGEGTHALTAVLDGMTATIAITVDNSSPASTVADEIIVDQYHSWPIELFATVRDRKIPVSPKAYEWISDNPSAVTVDENGCVTGVANGDATITGTSLAGTTVSIKVHSQCPPAAKADIAGGATDPATWTVSKASISTPTLSALGENGGFALDFKVTSTRSPQITATKKIQIWGLPDALEFVINPGDADVKSATLSTSIPDQTATTKTTLPAIISGQDNVITVPLGELCDISSVSSYPLSFNALRFDFSKTGTYRIEVKSLRAVYNGYDSGVDNIVADASAAVLPMTVADGVVSLPFAADTLEVHDLTGRLVASLNNASSVHLSAGFYLVTATYDGRQLTGKVRL